MSDAEWSAAERRGNRRAAAGCAFGRRRPRPLPRPTEWLIWGFLGPVGRSETDDRAFHLAMVFGLPPWRLASAPGSLDYALYRSTDRLVCLSCPPKTRPARLPEGWRPARVGLGLESAETEHLVRSPPPQSHTRIQCRSGPSPAFARQGYGRTTHPVFVGIDVSKDRLDACSSQTVRARHSVFHEEAARGMDDLVIRLQGLSVALVVLEATGGFEAPVAAALAGVGLPLCVVNPRQNPETLRLR